MANFKDIFFIKQPSDNAPKGTKPYWMKIGVAFPTKDGVGLNCKFDVIPPNMENIQIRDHVEKESFDE